MGKQAGNRALGLLALIRPEKGIVTLVLTTMPFIYLLPASLAKEMSRNEPEVSWRPKTYQYERYQTMLNKSPFGRLPLKRHVAEPEKPPPPKKELTLTIAAVFKAGGKPFVYLHDKKSGIYQKINAEAENENKIILVKVSDDPNPREVVAQVKIAGDLRTIEYDKSLFAGSGNLKMVKQENPQMTGELPKGPSAGLSEEEVRGDYVGPKMPDDYVP